MQRWFNQVNIWFLKHGPTHTICKTVMIHPKSCQQQTTIFPYEQEMETVFNHWVNDIFFSQVLRKLQQLSVFSQSSLQDTTYDCHTHQQALLFIRARTEKMLLDMKRKQMSLHIMSKSLHNEVLEHKNEKKTL